MNPIGEEVGQTARSIVGVFKDQALALSLVLMNIALLALFWWIIDEIAKRNDHREQAMRIEQREIRELLSRCVVSEQKT